MLDDGANRRLPEPPRVVVREDTIQQDCLCYRAACREGAEADETAKSDFRALVHLQPVEDENGNNSADEVGKAVKPEPYVTRQVGDVRRKTLAMNARIPDRSHWPALHEKQQDLGKVTGGAKGDDHPEERREMFPGPANDA